MRMTLIPVALGLAMAGVPGAILAQSVPVSRHESSLGERLVVESAVLSQDREVLVGLPADYGDSASYPLIVVLEGERLFEVTAALTRLMAEVGEIPPSIVVGIPLNGEVVAYAPRITGRPESGGADRMLEHYRTELFPALDSLYGTTGDRILWAHSALGGLFCTYALLGPDRQFTGILSSSPNLAFTREYLEGDDAFATLSAKGPVFYYLTFGGAEDPDYMDGMLPLVEGFAERLEREAPGNLTWTYREVPGNTHFTNAIETYVDGLTLYFRSKR